MSTRIPTALARMRIEPNLRQSPIKRVFSRIAQALTLLGLGIDEPRAILAWLSLEPTAQDSVDSGLAEAVQPGLSIGSCSAGGFTDAWLLPALGCI